MNDTLELEPIETTTAGQAPSSSTEVATAAAGAVDLKKVDLTDVALAQFGDWEADVKSATVKLTGLVLDMSNQAKLTEAKSLRQRTINVPVADARKVSTALKSKLTQASKAVGAREAEIVAAWGEVDKLIKPQIDKREKELADEKAMRDAITAGIRGCHEAEADKLRVHVVRAEGLSSEKIAKGIEVVEGLIFPPKLGAFLPLYEAAKADTLAGLRKHLEAAKVKEAADALAAERTKLAEEAEALARERADLMRLRLAATVFTFPEPEPEPETVVSVVPPAVEAVAIASEPIPQPATPAPVSLVAQNNAARVAIVEDSEPATDQLPVEPIAAPAAQDQAVAWPDDAELVEGEICLKLGAIVARFGGLGLTVDFITETLGVPRFQKVKASSYWRLSDLPAIRNALKAHADKCVP